MEWIGLVASFLILLVVARRSLWVGLTVASIVLGTFYLKTPQVIAVFQQTLTDPSILYLAVAVGLIPVIGGCLEESGLLGDLVNNMRIGKKMFLMSAPAFIGMLPIPGGAILSAPMLEKAGDDIPGVQKLAINIWFRHMLTMIYPLATLLPATKMASVDLYDTVLYILPVFIFLTFLGYVFFIRGIKGKVKYASPFDLAKLIKPMVIILSAPVVHCMMIVLGVGRSREFALMVAVSVSLVLAILMGRLKADKLSYIVRIMKPWRYVLIILSVFAFMNILEATGAARIIANMPFPRNELIVLLGILLGIITGRVIVPISIIIPVYQIRFGPDPMTPLIFCDNIFFRLYRVYYFACTSMCAGDNGIFSCKIWFFFAKTFFTVTYCFRRSVCCQ